jgi:hypothetical protein
MRVSRFRDITSITQPSPAFSLRVDALQNRRKKQRRTEKTATVSFTPTMIIPYERPWHFASVGVPTNVRFTPILLQNSFGTDQHKLSGPYVRRTNNDLWDYVIL